jgi:hypothetical protein
MGPNIVIAKVAGTTQAAQINAMAGKAYVVGKVTAAKEGLGSWLFLSPTGGAGTAGGTTAIKLEGTRQMAQLMPMVGKTVVVGKSPAVAGGIGKWIVLQPTVGAAAKGAAVAGVGAAGMGAGKAAAASQLDKMVMLKLEGGRQATQAAMLQGKTFTVVNPMVAGKGVGKWIFLKPAGAGAGADSLVALKLSGGKTAAAVPSLVGKTVTIGKAPMVAGSSAGKWLVLQPSIGAVGKAAAGAGTAGASKFVTVGATAGKSAPAMGTGIKGSIAAAAGKGAIGKTAVTGAAVAAKSTAATGTIWTGTGLSLGLGLGLGAWGPAILLGAATAGGYYYFGRKKKDVEIDENSDSDDLEAALG